MNNGAPQLQFNSIEPALLVTHRVAGEVGLVEIDASAELDEHCNQQPM